MKSPLHVVLLAVSICAACIHAADEYKIISKDVVGGDGGWDYPSIDPDAKRLLPGTFSVICIGK